MGFLTHDTNPRYRAFAEFLMVQRVRDFAERVEPMSMHCFDSEREREQTISDLVDKRSRMFVYPSTPAGFGEAVAIVQLNQGKAMHVQCMENCQLDHKEIHSFYNELVRLAISEGKTEWTFCSRRPGVATMLEFYKPRQVKMWVAELRERKGMA